RFLERTSGERRRATYTAASRGRRPARRRGQQHRIFPGAPARGSAGGSATLRERAARLLPPLARHLAERDHGVAHLERLALRAAEVNLGEGRATSCRVA